VAISPDNRCVVTGSSDKTARLWLLQMKGLIDYAGITVGRNFSADEWRLYFPSEKYRKTFDELPGLDVMAILDEFALADVMELRSKTSTNSAASDRRTFVPVW
jgi:hypothetical protein